jgi:hypothetical protein
MVHVGVDLDKRSSQIAVLTEAGEIVQQRLANDAARLEQFFAQLPRQTPVAIEASGSGGGSSISSVALARRLAEIVFHVWQQECDYFTVVRRGVVRG